MMLTQSFTRCNLVSWMLRGGALALVLIGPMSAARGGIIVTGSNNANTLAGVLTAGAGSYLSVTNASLISYQGFGGQMSAGTFSLSGPLPDTYGLTSSGVILSTGNVKDYGTGPNTNMMKSTQYGKLAPTALNNMIKPVTNIGTFPHYDVSMLDMTFDAGPNLNEICFQIVFGTEEWFGKTNMANDGFAAYFNGVNVAVVDGHVISTVHPGMTKLMGPPDTTELNGVILSGGSPLLTIHVPVVPGSTNNRFQFLIGDAVADTTDSTVYITAFVPNCRIIPEPGTWLLGAVGAGFLALAGWRRRLSHRTR